MKAIIPVAGLGTRLLPASKAIPKEMLPIVDRPVIQYIVHELASAGITDIVLVTHASKNAIENHFDTQFELEATLEKRLKRLLLDDLCKITPPGVKIMHIRQGQALGLGHAIFMAQPIIGNEDFVVVLPDMLIDGVLSDLSKENLAEMIQQFHTTKRSQVMVHPVAPKQVNAFGVVALENKAEMMHPGEQVALTDLVEKPEISEAPSCMAITGRYVLSKKIWKYLENQKAGAQDEIQLTDALQAYLMDGGAIDAYALVGKMYDCGSKLGLMAANFVYALRHPEIGKELSAMMHEYLETKTEV